jgi:hypothetical protein
LPACFENRNRKSTGKKYNKARRIMGMNISDSVIPKTFSFELNAIRKEPVIAPITNNNPRNINPKMAMNMVHFLVVLILFRVSCSISIFLLSAIISIIENSNFYESEGK